MNKIIFKITKRKRSCFTIVSFFIVLIILFLWARDKNETIIIGFSAQLTGSQAELGVQERNGVQLAIGEINELGGVNGRKVSLIIKDDCGIYQIAKKMDKELIDKGAVAIIGHATTAQTLEGLKVTNPANIVMIGPTVSTPELTGIDDYFFRVHPSFKSSAEAFAKHIYDFKKLKNIAVIYDTDNISYSKTYSKIFEDKFKELGGSITNEIFFSSSLQPDFSPVLYVLEKSKPEGLVIVASDIDTAIIAQRTKHINKNIKLFASDWAQTETLISNGGKAVEGMEIEQSFDVNDKSERFLDFKAKYKARFGNEPSFGSIYSYEATLVLAEALKKANCNKERLKESLLEINNFDGLIGKISIDKFGDVERPYYISKICGGKFNTINVFDSVNSGGEKTNEKN